MSDPDSLPPVPGPKTLSPGQRAYQWAGPEGVGGRWGRVGARLSFSRRARLIATYATYATYATGDMFRL